MRQTIAGAAFPYEGTPITVTVSLGVAVLQGEESAQDLVIRADAAMYRAKQEGRNRVRTDVRPEAA
jgi:diguanylate cyclase